MSARRRRKRERHPRSRWPWLITGGVVVAFVVMLAVLSRQPRGPGVGAHWHAAYSITLCGRALPPLPPSNGDVHTHGDGLIHIHPASAASSGRRATLAAFFATTQVTLTGSSITVPGQSYANGAPCSDGRAGTLKVLVQRKGVGPFTPVGDFLAFVPNDRDVVRIIFGP